MRYVPTPPPIIIHAFIRSSSDEEGVIPNETQPLDSLQSMVTSRNTSAPLTAQVVRDNASENRSVNDRKFIAVGTERKRIQSHDQSRQSEGGRFQTENPQLSQEMATMARKGRDLASTRPDDETSWEWVNHPNEHVDQHRD